MSPSSITNEINFRPILNAGAGEGIESMKKYQLFLIFVDICCNIIVEAAATDAVVIFIAFGLQGIAMIINFVMYIMGTASMAMRFGIRRGTIHHHESNAATMVAYFILTIWWYSLALRKTWTSVGEHFSFTFVQNVSETHEVGVSVVNSPSSSGIPITSSTNHSIGSNSTNATVIDFHPLWSSGFIALYTIHRTIAVLYYIIYVQTMFLLLNGPLLKNLGYYEADTGVDLFGLGDFEPRRHPISLETLSSVVDSNEQIQNSRGQTERYNGGNYEYDYDYDARKNTKSTRRTSHTESAYSLDSDSTPVKVIAGNSKHQQQQRQNRMRRNSDDFLSSVEFP